MTRYKLIIAYDGAEFHGWQKQHQPDPADPEAPPRILRTVQQTVEDAVIRTVRQPVILIGASRTDARVHALGQVAAFTAETSVPVERLHLAINSRLPDDVEVRGAAIVPDTFDPISDAVKKTYRYTFHTSPDRPLMDRHRVFHCFIPIDESAMNDAAARLVGEHDFVSFASVHHGRTSTVRTIYDCSVFRLSAERLVIEVTGNGFLYNMVRIIAGTLFEVGRGHWPPGKIDEILQAKDRRAAGRTMPPQGLCLMHIDYGGKDQL
ncbi:MAG TPA: tRNA pseudouridine(38-40) synthase TruA [Phycisphaeraceae bacterium]|nr:tRNA pseudouridine(38-40) synthase TruA [Phycisphaeraceae bacterium]